MQFLTEAVVEGFYQLHRLNFHGALKLLKEKSKTKRYKGSMAAYASGLYRICNFGANCLTSLLFYVLYCLDIHIMSLLSFGLWNWSLDFSIHFRRCSNLHLKYMGNEVTAPGASPLRWYQGVCTWALCTGQSLRKRGRGGPEQMGLSTMTYLAMFSFLWLAISASEKKGIK